MSLSFQLLNENKNGRNAPASTNKVIMDSSTGMRGFYSFYDTCRMVKEVNWTVVSDEQYMAPYAYKNKQWVSYDDMESIEVKVNFAMDKRLGGVMIWCIQDDDFNGNCSGTKYPLIKTVNRVFSGNPRVYDSECELPGPSYVFSHLPFYSGACGIIGICLFVATTTFLIRRLQERMLNTVDRKKYASSGKLFICILLLSISNFRT